MRSFSTAAELPLPRLTEQVLGGGSCIMRHPTFGAEALDGPIRVLTDPTLEEQTGVIAVFSERTGGVSGGAFRSLNLDGRMDDPDAATFNRKLLLEALGAAPDTRLVVPVQVHGSAVGRVFSSEETEWHGIDAGGCGSGADHEPKDDLVPIDLAGNRLEGGVECDAVLVDRPGVAAMLLYADCVPIILVAPGGTFCVVHSGWRGTIESISSEAVRALANASGADPSGFNAYIGPHIGLCCYEVDTELVGRFARRFGPGCLGGGEGRHLDLGRCVTIALQEAGVSVERIVDEKVCTADSTDRFFSHRAESGRTGRFGAVCYRKSDTMR